ncbi:hypothetical protein AVEN_63442-1 [Araneus ventricosus]|uniref:Uncharacterized protein n=1 Tax=Araneus ventricosus TaxID=182803 RepID=A0A4Y2TX01_ARAVE|nr:hypothetical protein AVEN_63442-1 [Araneus ventricosus]
MTGMGGEKSYYDPGSTYARYATGDCLLGSYLLLARPNGKTHWTFLATVFSESRSRRYSLQYSVLQHGVLQHGVLQHGVLQHGVLQHQCRFLLLHCYNHTCRDFRLRLRPHVSGVDG